MKTGRISSKVHLLAKRPGTVAGTLCGVDPFRVRISYLGTLDAPVVVTCPECIEANAPKVELTPGSIRRHGITELTVWRGKHYVVTTSKGGKYWSGIGSQAYAQMDYAIASATGGHVARITGRQTKAAINDFVRWAMVFDALEPQWLAEEAEEAERKQRLWDAQEKQAEKAELLRRNGPRMVKLLREAYAELNPDDTGVADGGFCDQAEALFKDLGEDVRVTNAAMPRNEADREHEVASRIVSGAIAEMKAAEQEDEP